MVDGGAGRDGAEGGVTCWYTGDIVRGRGFGVRGGRGRGWSWDGGRMQSLGEATTEYKTNIS